MKEMTIDALPENLAAVQAFIDEQLEAVECPMKIQMQIDIAVEEIFINIAYYAFETETGKVTISMEIANSQKTAVITFSDNGKQYDPLKKPDPDITLSVEERQIGGLGIYIVKKSMDDMKYEYSDGKNRLTLVKKLFT